MPIDANQALQLCIEMCDAAIAYQCAVPETCASEECPQFVFDARTECLDEFATMWKCRKEHYETVKECYLFCIPEADVVDACRKEYGCWRSDDPCYYEVGGGPNGETICNCTETCEKVPYTMNCLIGQGQTTCDCFVDGSPVGSCVLEKESCSARVQETCCMQFFNL